MEVTATLREHTYGALVRDIIIGGYTHREGIYIWKGYTHQTEDILEGYTKTISFI